LIIHAASNSSATIFNCYQYSKSWRKFQIILPNKRRTNSQASQQTWICSLFWCLGDRQRHTSNSL